MSILYIYFLVCIQNSAIRQLGGIVCRKFGWKIWSNAMAKFRFCMALISQWQKMNLRSWSPDCICSRYLAGCAWQACCGRAKSWDRRSSQSRKVKRPLAQKSVPIFPSEWKQRLYPLLNEKRYKSALKFACSSSFEVLIMQLVLWFHRVVLRTNLSTLFQGKPLKVWV